MVIWKEAGFFMIFYLAALQQLSPDLEEAAAVEGAGRWYIFRRITLPLLMPTTLFVVDQRGDQFVQADRPLVIMTEAARQRQDAAALLHLRGRLHVLGLRLCGDADGRAAGDPGTLA